LPFNQASRQDCQSLVDWIYNVKALDLDIVVPFAAISENGRDIGNIDDRSELAHRLMLTNLTRLLGHVKAAKGA
jgi:3-oxoacyl-ACP reductase-like protein